MCERYQIPLDKFLKEYSTGMKAKLNLIIALTHQAEFLMLDEPTAGLDVGAREGMLDILREYMEEEPERSILISSHISSDLEHLCDDIYVIHNRTASFFSRKVTETISVRKEAKIYVLNFKIHW